MTESQINKREGKQRTAWPWIIIVLDLLAVGVLLYFTLLNRTDRIDWSIVACASFPLSAAIILYGQPRNKLGWVLAVMGLVMLLGPTSSEYAHYALVTQPGNLPLGAEAAWFSYWIWTLWEPLPVIAIMLFPNGSLPSRRWWWLIAIFVVGDLPVTVLGMVVLWPLRGPFLYSQDAILGIGSAPFHFFFEINEIWSIIFVVFLVLAVLGVGVRFRRSQDVERQQLKWVLLALIFVPVSNALGLFITSQSSALLQNINFVFSLLGILGFPVAMTFAVTRYHLYDIDVIIRRTLLYGALTIVIGLLYSISIILLQTLLARIGGEHSSLIVVLSTLIIAAAFNPLRVRFQTFIDQRFYRKKYNSALIMERFTSGLRSEVDLGAIHQNLLAVVDESLRPDYSALWLVRTHDRLGGEKNV